MQTCLISKRTLLTSYLITGKVAEKINQYCPPYLFLNVEWKTPFFDRLGIGNVETGRVDILDDLEVDNINNVLFNTMYDYDGDRVVVGCAISDIVRGTDAFCKVVTSGLCDNFDETSWVCSRCFKTVKDEEQVHHNPYGSEGYMCDNCNHIIEEEPVKPYTYRPHPKFRGVDKNNMYIGAEIEVNVKYDCFEYEDYDMDDIEVGCMTEVRTEAYRIAKDSDRFVYCKFDRSVGIGFEIVTHPFTYSHELESGPVKAVFDSMGPNLMAGRSDGISSCGVHLHVSKEAVPVGVAVKIAKFMSSNKNLIRTISHRDDFDHMERFASLNILGGSYQMSAISRDEHRESSHYSAFHVTKNTYEFRIFNSTTKYEEFMSFVEFVVGIISYFKQPNSYDTDKFISYMSRYENFKEQNKSLYVKEGHK